VITVVAIVLAIFVLPRPWGIALVAAAATTDLAQTFAYMRWSTRRRARVGAETLVGRTAVVVSPLSPRGQVKVDGELWAARSDVPVETGSEVVIRGLEKLTFVVEPARRPS
jgi:membrane protein implicated in regulation of membrane protease activity